MIKKFDTFLNEGERISKRYSEGAKKYAESFLEELKNELEGKTVYIKVNKVNKLVKKGTYTSTIKTSCYEVTIKSVRSNSTENGDRSPNYYIIDENGQRYRLKEIVTEEEYNKWKEKEKIERAALAEKKRKEAERKEKIKVFDPYGEEDWGEDDFSEEEEKPVKQPGKLIQSKNYPHLFIKPEKKLKVADND